MVSTLTRAALLGGLLISPLVAPGRVPAEIAAADLNMIRSVTERDWIGLRLQVLGLKLSYPAYRVHLELSDGPSGPAKATVRYTFWLSAGMADHLMDAGRTEAERVLSYHGRGIGDQVADLIQSEFPDLLARFDPAEDVEGRFLTPGESVDDAPQELAEWRAGELKWTSGRR